MMMLSVSGLMDGDWMMGLLGTETHDVGCAVPMFTYLTVFETIGVFHCRSGTHGESVQIDGRTKELQHVILEFIPQALILPGVFRDDVGCFDKGFKGGHDYLAGMMDQDDERIESTYADSSVGSMREFS